MGVGVEGGQEQHMCVGNQYDLCMHCLGLHNFPSEGCSVYFSTALHCLGLWWW